jgi:hypothetical protein
MNICRKALYIRVVVKIRHKRGFIFDNNVLIKYLCLYGMGRR